MLCRIFKLYDKNITGIIVICCWKCAVSVKDKQEYKKFIEDMENAKFAEVSCKLYKSTVQLMCVCTYAKNWPKFDEVICERPLEKSQISLAALIAEKWVIQSSCSYRHTV